MTTSAGSSTVLHGRPEKKKLYEKARLTLKKRSEDIAEELEDERVIEAEGKLAEHAKIMVGESVSAGITIVLGRRFVYINQEPRVSFISNPATKSASAPWHAAIVSADAYDLATSVAAMPFGLPRTG